MHELQNHLRWLDPHTSYLQWFDGQVEDIRKTLPFFGCKVLECVRYLLGQITYQDELVYGPRQEFNPNGQTIYTEMPTADWWCEAKLEGSNLFSGNLS